MLKKIFIIFAVVTVIGLLVLFGYKRRDGAVYNSVPAKLKVVASFYVLSEFARQVGGDNIEVVAIVPSGAEPHEYEPTPKDIAAINSARLFLYQGGGFDRWAERIAKEIRLKGVVVIPIVDSFALKDNNPHIWLDPALVQKEIEIIRDALINIDPQNADLYARNSARYIDLLASLDEKYKNGLADCATKDMVTPHPAFQYLADRYGLSLIAIGVSPEQEPSLRRVAEIIQSVRSKGIKYIFTEPLSGSKVSEMIARETGTEVLELNPIEGLTETDIAANKNYISLMTDNLQTLKVALACNASIHNQ